MTKEELDTLALLFAKFTKTYYPYGENQAFVDEFMNMIGEVEATL